MKYQVMLPVAAALSLALAAGCERRSTEDTSGSTRTTSATPTTESTGAPTPGTSDTAGVPRTSDTATGTTVTTGAAAEKPLAEHDKEFITKAASGSMAAVALGTTASQKATLPELKSFADRMVSDHGKAQDELKALAAKKGVALPTEIGKDPKKEQEKLSALTGNKFDKEYADAVVKDQERELKDFQEAARDAKDPDVKAWAAKMVPILEEHVKNAKQLETKVKR